MPPAIPEIILWLFIGLGIGFAADLTFHALRERRR